MSKKEKKVKEPKEKKVKDKTNGKNTGTKAPMSHTTIFKIMMYLTFAVAGVFLLKNIISMDIVASAVIGLALFIFAAMILILKTINQPLEVQECAVSISLLFVVFIISLFSGASYSDDFLLYLAIVGLSGLYFRPLYARIQIIVADILLVLQAIIHPEKVGETSQFIMCMAIFTLVGFIFYLVIKRGQAFINRSMERAKEAEDLLIILRTTGIELRDNCEDSSVRLKALREVNSTLENHTNDLRYGSENIIAGAQEVMDTCADVHSKMRNAGNYIDDLNREVRYFEDALARNRQNMNVMDEKMEFVKNTMHEASEVFFDLQRQMRQITVATKQLNEISENTTMLALNASIEASKAGNMGSGFAVVASKVQELADDSNDCSVQVETMVAQMQNQIKQTRKKLSDTVDTVDDSINTLDGLKHGFATVIDQFGSLYNNIEVQNNNVSEVEDIFAKLEQKIKEMQDSSEDNQTLVDYIVASIGSYKANVATVIEDTSHVHELSASMMNMAELNSKKDEN